MHSEVEITEEIEIGELVVLCKRKLASKFSRVQTGPS